MRAQTLASLPDQCEIRRASNASDGYGGTTKTWSTVATVAVRIAPLDYAGDAEEDDMARITTATRWMATFAHDTDVRLSDQILWDSSTFEIVNIDSDRSWQLQRRCSLRRVS